jgi:hypothetical protein
MKGFYRKSLKHCEFIPSEDSFSTHCIVHVEEWATEEAQAQDHHVIESLKRDSYPIQYLIVFIS